MEYARFALPDRMMSIEKDNSNNIGRLLEPNSSASRVGQLCLYYVRMHEVKDKLKVQLDFGKNITFTFGEGKHLCGKDSMGPVIYTLNLMLIMVDDTQLYVEHNEQFKSIGEYRLNISYTSVIGKHFEEKRDFGHSLCDYLENEHLFLFDIHFHSYYGFHLPGEDTGLFTDLCLFTCYLLNDKNYDLFNVLANQFQITMLKDNYTFTRRDFQDFFEKCLKYLQYTSTDLLALIVTIRMMALLTPMTKENFDRYCSSASEFTNKIMHQIRTNFPQLFRSVDKSKWPLLKKGLGILSAFELLYQKLDHSDHNKLDFLHQISDEKLRQDIANEILLQLSSLDQPIIANSNWTNLFTMVDSQQIKIHHLNLVASFETLILCITKISEVLKDYHHFEKQLAIPAFYDYLPIDLNSILYLLKFFDQELSNDCAATKHLLTTVQWTIRNSDLLKQKIEHYFNRLELTVQNMEEIQLIICSISKYSILDYINKYEYLERSLSNLQSASYYIKWFQCFLANSQIRDNKEKQLLALWINCLKEKDKDWMYMLMAMDRLLAPFDPLDWFYLYFINRMIDLCFEQDSIFSVITNSLLQVKNEQFRTQFKIAFDRRYLQDSSQELTSPLYELIELDKRENSQSMLVYDLIELICNKIGLTNDCLIQDTFYQPTERTLTYLILFDRSFVTLPIRMKIMKQLIPMWIEWEEEGFQISEINSWFALNHKQREIVCQIWNLIGETLNKTIRFEQLINKADQQIKDIIRINESVTLYLNNYCQNAHDKNNYLTDIHDIQYQLKIGKINLIKIPQLIETIHPSIHRLNSIFESHVWQKFLHQHDKKILVDHQQITCLTILKQTELTLDLFTEHMNNLWNDRTQPILPQLEQLFPEKYLIDHEFDIIKRLLDIDVIPYVEQLLHYWKNHEHIIHICRGCINLFEKYKIKNPEKTSILQNILDINEQTTGEACLVVYQDYMIQFSNNYSDAILNFLSQWSLANELLEFLYPLTNMDMENLLDVVNDWDETLINTRTVLEFVLLKSFFDQADALIKSVQTRKPLEFDDIITCFELISKKFEFKNLLNIFNQCSASLSSIRHIYTASTDKEQSKRKRILEIMQNAHFGFCIHQSTNAIISTMEHEFNVCITTTDSHSKPSYFIDLSELRDRARLIEYANNSTHKIQIAKYTDDDIQQIRSIISFTEMIEVILKSLTALNRAGYPCVTQYLLPEKEFVCNQGNYEELERFKGSLETELTVWDKQLCEMYEKCIDLTYFSYQQIWIVEKSLYERTAMINIDPGYHLLRFIGIDPQSIQSELLPSLTEEYHERLKNLAQIFNTQRMHRNSLQQDDEPTSKKIFLIQISYKGILRAIFSLFHQSNLSISANQLFYCTKNTNWIEIRAFTYRCFYSQKLHQLIQPELLSIIIQDQFAQLLNQLIEQHTDHVFRLGIITTVSTVHLHLVNGLKLHRTIQTLYDQDLLSEPVLDDKIQTLIGNNCILVTSKIAGLGKSTNIRNQASQLGKQLIKFPISGDVNIDTLADRLRAGKIQSASSPIAIHIDIGPVENVQQLNEFLYCLILFRCFRLGQMPVCVPTDIPIYVELDSSAYLSNLKNDLVILQYLKTKHIDRLYWDDLKNNILQVKFVANYLQAIEDKTINIRDIHERTITTLDKSTCIHLLQKHFVRDKKFEFISWTQLSIFISVYYKLFSGFSKCGYFVADPTDKSSLRLDILNSLLNSSDQFTSLSVETVRQNQRSVYTNETFIPFSDAIIQWDKSQPFTLIFTSTYEPLFIYKSLNDVPSSLTDAFLYYYQVLSKNYVPTSGPQRLLHSLFKKRLEQATTPTKTPEQQLEEFLINPNKMTHEQFFLRLTSLSTKYFTHNSICLICFNQFDYVEQLCPKCLTEDSLIRPISTNSQDIENFQKKIAEKLHSEYIFTPDNYIKMLLIYLRVQSNLPVLIMGETGCGKTALIRCLCEKFLNDEMKVFHIHAGVTNEKIIETMHDFIDKAQKCSEKDSKKRLWVFFDEFNTTPNIGLLKEIICERTLLGRLLPKNMVFLGACNPQRRKKDNQELQDNIGIKKYYLDAQRLSHGVDSPLLYSVVSIPETMLEHIWDYGYINPDNEKCYIKTILNACEQLTTDQIWFRCIVKSISVSQKYFRECEDVSSVSLRDVARFCRFYNWFYKFPLPSEREEMHINQIECASSLALFLCYYFRLDSCKKRQEYARIVKDCIKKYKRNTSLYSPSKLLESVKMALVNRMELPLGTAKNRALTDNIFVLFTCIVNRLPVILCGQPGSSKTLAVQIIISNLKGKKSADPFFQTLPELIAISYQGSHNCTSESIIKVFAQADKCAQANNDADILPVIVFDEIGLAELSLHNPLKVLHSELEIETCRYGFVGLSNWRLDASKMNRAIYLSTPDPNLGDLKITAITLSRSMLSNNTQAVPLGHSVIEGLAFAYIEMCEHLKQQRNQHYFGLRDYYSLIKGIVYDMIHKQNQERDLHKIIRYHLSLNFDGIIDGSKFMWSKFCEHMHQDHKITEYSSPIFDQLIDQSLSSRTGRFLMLIGESENAFDYVQRYITIEYASIQTRTLIGSSLAGDYLSNTTYTEQYNTRVLMDIILYAEKEITLFLRGLGHLYDNLYDLFNQNFAVSAKKKFCRIALGSLHQLRCMVNDNFYCVVFIKKQDLDKYDPPFLNRFEKHLIDIETLIDDRHQTIVSKLKQWLNQCSSMKTNKNVSHSKYLSTWFNDDYILNLVTDAFDQMPLSNNDQDILKYCQEQIIRNSSFDFPLLLSLEPTNDRDHIIQQYYEIHAELSFSSFINQILQQEKIPKLLIYTYTQIYDDIDYSDINNHQKMAEEIKLSHFKTELELIQKIKMHYQNGSSRLLCIRVDYHEDHQHLPMLKHLLLNEQVGDESRGICLIFHLQRNKLHQIENDVFFNGWSSVMIDNLEKHQLIPQNILSNPSYADLVSHLTSLDLETAFIELIHPCIRKFRYIVTDKNREQEVNERCDKIIEQLILRHDKDDQLLRSHIKKYLLEIISNSRQTQFNDWREDLLTNEIVIGSCCSFIDALTKNISFFMEKYFSLLFAHLEKHSMIDSYLFLIDSDEKMHDKLRQLWIHCWTTIVKNIDVPSMSPTYIEIPLVFDLHLPCATTEYEIIRQIRQTIAQNRQDDESSLDFAYKQLINTSVYGQFINTIFADPDLFDSYYHDQLTLIRDEANLHQLSTSFIQCLLTSKISGTVKDQLIHLLVDYDELLEIMRIFEISTPFLGGEDIIFEYLSQQLVIDSDIQDNNNLYRLVIRESNFHLVLPGSSVVEENIFDCTGNPFIEISLMNLLELFISPTHIDRINNMEQLITIFGLVIQSMITLSRGHYEINNLEKIQSFLRLASSLSILFSNDKALDVLKQIYNHNNDCIVFHTVDQIHNFITDLNHIIHQQQSTANNIIIQQTLLKLKSELLRNWFIDNEDKYDDLLTSINHHDLWKCSAKIFTIIDTSLKLSSTIREYNGQISQIDECKQINGYLSQLNDPRLKIEILLSMRIYMQLILDENYQPRIKENSRQQLIEILNTKFDYFKENLDEMERIQNEQRLERISLIAWLKYYLLYYVYALKHDKRNDILDRIDRILTRNNSAFCSTVKLYIIKQLCYSEKITFHDLFSKYKDRNVHWISSMINPSSNTRQDIILPTPLFECKEEFLRISKKFSLPINHDQLKGLVEECSQRPDTTYCFLIWFIYYYTRFYVNNFLPDDPFVNVIQSDINKKLITTRFEPIGYQLIYSLCTNFDDKSYFRLNPSMSTDDIHQRLLVLNIIALLISFKSSKTTSFLGSLLFDADFKMPQNYTEYFKKFDSLPGVALAIDPAFIQMINTQTEINLHKNSKIDIIRCSSDCYWLYCIVNCEIPIDQKQCPLCRKEINVSRNDDLLIIKKPHIRIAFNETSQFTSQYIEQHKQKEKPGHLNQPLTYHFINFFTNAIFLFLNELKYLPSSTPAISTYFQESIATNYRTIRQHLLNVDQCYIWLYKLINHMMNENFVIHGYLNSPEKVIQLEQFIEDKLIIPHLGAAISEIREYKLLYADFVYGNNKDKEIINFVNELVEDRDQYPLLHFFNITNIHSIDIIDDLHRRLQLLPDYKKTYPLTTFLLERLSDYENIPYLYPIIRFMNYLMQQFDHRISRNIAKTRIIADCLKDNSDLETIYKQFLDVWFKISLKGKTILQHSQSKPNFENRTTISMFLLSKFNENENMIPTDCLHTLANLQNDIVHYFHSNLVNCRAIPIQSIQQKQLFDFGTNKMRKLLVEKGMMINYEYGMSQEIIYDYDEIEWILRNEISCLPLIDVKNIRYFNYQFELYDENVSLINDIRKRFEQKLFDDNERAEIKRVLYSFDNHSILQLSGLLECALAYLRTAISTTMTIEKFIRQYIHPKGSTDNQIFRKKPFSSIQLQFIVDLNELIEECVFDQILRNNIRNEFREQSFPNNQRTSIIKEFIDMILHDQTLADCLKDLNCWISMFKRLLMRLLSSRMNINFESPLHDYVRRSDMWKGNITEENIRTIEIKRNIRLKHAFIILKRLEAELNEKTSTENDRSPVSVEPEKPTKRPTFQRNNSILGLKKPFQKLKDSKKKNNYR